MNQAIIISIIGLTISILSAIFTFIQAICAKKAYSLQKQIYDDALSSLSLIIEDSFYRETNDTIYYRIKLNIANISDKDNSIQFIYFNIINDNCFPYKVKQKRILKRDTNRLDTPLFLKSHSSVSGWVTYELDKKIYKDFKIKSHYIEVVDINNNIYQKEEIYIRKDENRNEKQV